MTSYRLTTNGLYRSYRNNLGKNNSRLKETMTTVQTGRQFNTYAEDPAAASEAWRLRRSYWRTGDQIDNSNYLSSKFQSAYNAMDSIVDGDSEVPGLDGIYSAVTGISDSAGSSRTALGKELIQKAENMVAVLNSKYGDDFIFAGADGAKAPFEWQGSRLLYRGVDVNAAETDPEYAKLDKMAREATYVDIGLGMELDANGQIKPNTAFNSAISGLKFLGYGKDNNLAVTMHELGEIFSRCDVTDGSYTTAGDEERASELLDQLHDQIRYSQNQHVQLSSDAKFLHTNLSELEEIKSELNEQIVEVEEKDMGEAITEMSWAQYCYNAALRIGTNLLSQSLIDYMN